mmetsp:Transcript_1608/g.2807  ORF Transcript_1608/g.2807 Transcript_1608/m.2807 type:complete len:407 (+) Transcript_1608:224-1444(+)
MMDRTATTSALLVLLLTSSALPFSSCDPDEGQRLRGRHRMGNHFQHAASSFSQLGLKVDNNHVIDRFKRHSNSTFDASFDISIAGGDENGNGGGGNSDSTTSSSVQPRIIGGSASEEGEFPYYVALNGCGASLIAPGVVLSAAHCAPYGDEYIGRTVRVGAFRMNKLWDTNSIDRVVVEQANHPAYSDQTVDNDFMLLRLAEPVEMDTTVTLELSNNVNDIQGGNELTVLGLGVTANCFLGFCWGGNSAPSQLMDVDIQAYSDADCIDAYGVGTNGVQIDSMFCAGAVGRDSCSGDSGGPLVRRVGNVHYQVGVVSWGIGCADSRFPGVYARIPSYGYEWIKQVVCDQWGESASFCIGGAGGGAADIPVVDPPEPPPANDPVDVPPLEDEGEEENCITILFWSLCY